MEPPFTASPPWNTSLSGLPFFPALLHPQATPNRTEPVVSGSGGGVDLSQSLALCAMIVMEVLAVVGNLAVMVVISRTPQLRKFAFVFHLCLVDLVAALVLMPLGMLSDWVVVNETLCRSYLCLSVCLVSAAILTICAINVERYYYIVHPMRHEVKMTVGVVVLVLVGIWVKAVVMSVLPLLGWLLQGSQEQGVPLDFIPGQRQCWSSWCCTVTCLKWPEWQPCIMALCPLGQNRPVSALSPSAVTLLWQPV